MRNESEAINISAPTGFDQAVDGTGALDRCRCQAIAFTTASSSPTQITVGAGVGYYTLTADQNVQLRFWSSDGTSGNPAFNVNQSSDFPLWQYAYVNFVLDGYLWVRAKGMTSTGTLYVYASNR